MKKIYSLLMTIAIAAGLTSCSDNWSNGLDGDTDNGVGQVRLSTLGVEVSDAEDVVNSRDGSDVDLSTFIVEISDKESGAPVKSWKYSEMPEVLTLPVGTYTVKVRSHEQEKQAWDKPYYEGAGEFAIVKDEVTDLGTVLCKFANIRVTIQYTDELRARLADGAKVTVVANDEGRLVYLPTETRSGYFMAIAGSNTIAATFEGYLLDSTGKAESELFTYSKSYTDAAPGKHYRITFRLKTNGDAMDDETGSVNPSVGIDATISEEDNGVEVPVNEDNLPDNGRPQEGEEDPDTPDTPGDPVTPGAEPITITSTTLSFTGNNTPSEYGDGLRDAIVKIHADKGMAHLNVQIISTNDDFLTSAGELMPMTFDLANPGEYGSKFASIGFPVGSEVIGATDIDFNITSLAPLLDAFTGTHKFVLTVIDSEGNELEKSITFVVL